MRRFLKPMAILFCLATAVSCKKNQVVQYIEPVINNPVTDYDVVPDPTDAFTFTFKNKTANFKRLEWRFGDDTLKTDDSPVHTYLATGKYTVDLKAFSSTNASTRKFVDLNIVPDSIVKITTTRASAVTGYATLQFGITVKAPVAKVVWTFNDAAYTNISNVAVPAKTESFTYTSLANPPSRTYAVSTFNTFTVTVTTTKGSVVVLSRSITTEGIAEDITQKRVGFTPALENGSGSTGNEGSSKLFDGNTATKFGVYGQGSNIKNWAMTVTFGSPVTAKLYMIANANDSQNSRDPRSWFLEGSNDGTNWVQLDYQVNGTGFYDKAIAAGATSDAQRYFRKWYYPIANPQPVTMYKLSFRDGSFGNDAIQLSEFALFR